MQNIATAFGTLGLRGSLRSVYHSFRHTSRLSSLLVHRNVITDIHPRASLNIANRLTVGLYNPGTSHPKAGKSIFSITAGGSVAHTGEESATIGPKSSVHVEGDLSLGDCRLNSDIRLLCGDEITIGDRVSVGWGVQLVDDNRHALRVSNETQQRSAPITIGDDVWIGHSSTITKGVEIADGAIVASNSVVLDDVPAETIVGGCPAETIVDADIDWEH